METITSEDAFWKQWPTLAGQVFEHRDAIDQGIFGFDSAIVDRDHASVKLSCVAVNGWGRDELWISASREPAGPWTLQHTIRRAK